MTRYLRRLALKPKVTKIKSEDKNMQVQKLPIKNRHISKSRFQPIKQNVVQTTKKSFTPTRRRNQSHIVTYTQTPLSSEQILRVKSLKASAKGTNLVILGNGPSLKDVDTFELKKLPNVKLCTINVPDSRCWPTSYWAFFDRSQYFRHKDLYYSFEGTIFNSSGIRELNNNSIKFRSIPGVGFSRDSSKGIYVGMSSVYATLQIAFFMQFDKIFVLGCDMSTDVDLAQTHFYGVNPDVSAKDRIKRFEKEVDWYNRMAKLLSPEERKKITFCSKGINTWSFINEFNAVEPSKALSFIKQETQNAR